MQYIAYVLLYNIIIILKKMNSNVKVKWSIFKDFYNDMIFMKYISYYANSNISIRMKQNIRLLINLLQVNMNYMTIYENIGL